MAPARILVVEDDRVVARDLAQQMSRAGHTVVGITARGEDAVPLAAETAPDLVLMDVRLEGELDGIDTARLLRENFNLPVVFLTAYADEETVRRATLTEPFGYVLKPFDDMQLRTVVDMALYKHGAERRLRESEQRYAVTLSSIGDAVIATDRESCITFINPVAETLTGWASHDAMGRPLVDVFRVINETTRAPAKDPVTAVLSAGTIVELANHTLLLSRDGHEIAIENSGSPIVDDRGEILGVVLVFRDVTQRRRAEEAEILRETNARLEMAMHGSNVGVWEIDMPDGDHHHGFAQFSNIWEWLGFTRPTTLLDYDAYMSVLHPDDRARTEAAIQRYLKRETDVFEVENRLCHRDGTIRWVLVRGMARWNASGKPIRFVGSLVDITQLKLTEQALRSSEARFRGTFENAAVGIAHCDLDGHFLRLNQRLCDIVGHQRETLLLNRFQDIADPDFLVASEEKYRSLTEGRLSHYSEEMPLVRLDGSRVWVSVSVALQRDANGRALHTIAILQDISARKALEDAVRVAKDAAESANRAKDQFLANISHELRTPLNGILGYAQILRRDAAMTERQLSSLKVIEQSGEHLLMLINDILDFARIEAGKLELNVTDVPLGPFIRVIAEMVSVRADQKNLVLNLEAPANLSLVIRVDEKRLRQVLLNLLANAVKFTDQGEVTLVVRMISDGRLRFEVRDTGVGVSPDRLETIFHPFEQAGNLTQRTGGVGLGLAISRQLVQVMGGDIHVTSTVGSGSTFWFELDVPVSYAEVADFSPTLQVADREGEPRQPVVIDNPIVPPPEEMATLHRFALLGSMRAIVHHADYLINLDARYEAFATQLRRLASAFESQALLSMIERHLDRDS
ncbi:hybrid sensor histidine kinase/response regulator [Paraburkholderia ginsengiterrae]|uniref:Virulence sensor protein BvgS n=1 Tax=Paraburkholderia ginsengiterrae TaxID=1462993 RepID=A0A1A9N8D8_9BURK|nr:PAS domain S-box protein [Paraburkholderia ginsengiterrae]OAJ54941.1 hybrid sensor histidine kinase/response regulator [Paraburkholderia ginsengiterrae]OAJ61125.1 hybrid sensor histidine kinase/response regulator [Paraburkholderia ginsengiterrae]